MVTIRLATTADIPQLVVLLAELFTLEADFQVDPEKQADGLGLLIASPKDVVLVAELIDTDTVIGMCSVQTLISTAEGGAVGIVEDLIISKAYRKQGIASGLLAAVFNWSERQGLKRLQLLADQNNSDALDFYKKQGWQTTQLICLRAAEYNSL
ncbi:MAG: GNAT family N-acetyltransferase [Methylococcales bacterium]